MSIGPFTPPFTHPPGTLGGTISSMTFKIASSRSSLCLRPTSCRLMGALSYADGSHCPAICFSMEFLGACGKESSRGNWEEEYWPTGNTTAGRSNRFQCDEYAHQQVVSWGGASVGATGHRIASTGRPAEPLVAFQCSKALARKVSRSTFKRNISSTVKGRGSRI